MTNAPKLAESTTHTTDPTTRTPDFLWSYETRAYPHAAPKVKSEVRLFSDRTGTGTNGHRMEDSTKHHPLRRCGKSCGGDERHSGCDASLDASAALQREPKCDRSRQSDRSRRAIDQSGPRSEPRRNTSDRGCLRQYARGT